VQAARQRLHLTVLSYTKIKGLVLAKGGLGRKLSGNAARRVSPIVGVDRTDHGM
jgi:hypothetical protein